MHQTQRQLLSRLALAVALLLAPGCGPALVGEEQEEETGAAFEPDDDEGRQTFTVGLSPGTAAEVCKTGGSGLNLRTGPSTGHHVITVMAEDHRVTIQASSGSWYRISSSGKIGYSYGYYLCKAGSSGGGGGGGGSAGGGGCTGSFRNPVPGAPVTSNFGPRWGRMHEGIDLGVGLGTAVHAADGGVVEFAGWLGGYGYALDVLHCGKHTTRYAHLSHFVAHHGQKVSKGDTIAKSGSTGNSTGPHLHFEIRLGGRWGKAVNPRNYISF